MCINDEVFVSKFAMVSNVNKNNKTSEKKSNNKAKMKRNTTKTERQRKTPFSGHGHIDAQIKHNEP